MTGAEIAATEPFQRCLAFHGHLCPGLAIGYRAARAGLDRLAETRSEDEEVVAIVENDACGCDAVQVLAGCTFGKGNLLFRDHGKQVYVFLARRTGEGVRVSLRPDAFPADDRHRDLMQRVGSGRATEEEASAFRELHRRRSHDVLERPEEELFEIRAVRMELPPRARIHASRPCDRCGESTMVTRLRETGGQRVCMDCLGDCSGEDMLEDG